MGFSVFFGRRTAWMFGRTPPWAIVTPPRSLFNSSSFLMASCKCRGMIRVFLLSLAAFPASSNTSALQHQLARRSYPFGEVDGLGRLGTEVRLGWIGISAWPCSFRRLYLFQT